MDARLEEGGRQFVKFAVVGGFGTIVNLVVLKATLFLWGHLVGEPPFGVEIFASGLAFARRRRQQLPAQPLVDVPLHAAASPASSLKFLIVSLAGLGLNELAFWVFRGQLDIGVLVSQCLAIVCVLPFNFIVNKLWSFRES